MKHFSVEVGERCIKVWEQDNALSAVHVRANVDGERFAYQIKKAKYANLGKGWFSRGSNHAYYHAKNSGSHVRFEHVTRKKKSKKEEVSPKQMEMLG